MKNPFNYFMFGNFEKKYDTLEFSNIRQLLSQEKSQTNREKTPLSYTVFDFNEQDQDKSDEEDNCNCKKHHKEVKKHQMTKRALN